MIKDFEKGGIFMNMKKRILAAAVSVVLFAGNVPTIAFGAGNYEAKIQNGVAAFQ